jgi:hypothetical protein
MLTFAEQKAALLAAGFVDMTGLLVMSAAHKELYCIGQGTRLDELKTYQEYPTCQFVARVQNGNDAHIFIARWNPGVPSRRKQLLTGLDRADIQSSEGFCPLLNGGEYLHEDAVRDLLRGWGRRFTLTSDAWSVVCEQAIDSNLREPLQMTKDEVVKLSAILRAMVDYLLRVAGGDGQRR